MSFPEDSQPDLRIAWSPDRNHVLITWRLVSGREISDNATACLVLDKNLDVVKGPFSPLLGARRNCQLLRIGIADDRRLLFWVRAYSTGNALSASQSGSFHLLEYDDESREVREIRLDTRGNIMMDARLHFAEDGTVSVAGWWINGTDPGRNAGVYFGQIGEEDTVSGLRMTDFSPQIRREMLTRMKSDGNVWFRPNYNNQLLPTDTGFLYVLHLLGDLKPELSNSGSGRPQNNALITYTIDREGRPGDWEVKRFCNEARSDYKKPILDPIRPIMLQALA